MRFTRKEHEFLTLVDMGVPSMRDIAMAMRVTSPRASHLRNNIFEKDCDLDVEFHNLKVETAIEMAVRGVKWREIAKELGYSNARTAYKAVATKCGGMKNIWDFVSKKD